MTKFKAHKLWYCPCWLRKRTTALIVKNIIAQMVVYFRVRMIICFALVIHKEYQAFSERGSTCAEVGRSNSGFIIFSKTCQIHSTYIAFPSLAFAAQVVCRPLLLLFLWNLRLHAYWQYCPCMFDANQKNIAQRVPTLLRHIWKNVLFLPLELY
ncbi:uncharacterized protein LOC122297658 isoform X2 [Carya illinoinensis]|uniref:uncharacterized protein LOC122297658 isoform X2 n=2 Tax=Carya illinoinensis TaxID=32201 RepID=UPI001C72338D|nr:uncharacterized protein LOC122297658 isoform X2 [Carya illinoinensis]